MPYCANLSDITVRLATCFHPIMGCLRSSRQEPSRDLLDRSICGLPITKDRALTRFLAMTTPANDVERRLTTIKYLESRYLQSLLDRDVRDYGMDI
jgi:hypothetical protein